MIAKATMSLDEIKAEAKRKRDIAEVDRKLAEEKTWQAILDQFRQDWPQLAVHVVQEPLEHVNRGRTVRVLVPGHVEISTEYLVDSLGEWRQYRSFHVEGESWLVATSFYAASVDPYFTVAEEACFDDLGSALLAAEEANEARQKAICDGWAMAKAREQPASTKPKTAAQILVEALDTVLVEIGYSKCDDEYLLF